MAKQIFDEITTTAIVRDGSDEIWEFTENSSVHVSTGPALTISGSSNRYTMSGMLASDADYALNVTGNDNIIALDHTASLAGGSRGLSFTGADITTYSQGSIEGADYGVFYEFDTSRAACQFGTSGTVSSASTALFFSADKEIRGTHMDIDISEKGVVSGDSIAIHTVNMRVTLSNLGTIEGDTAYMAGGPTSLRNRGNIIGDIYLAGGHSTLNTVHGTIDGKIFSTGSNATLITDNADYHFTGGENNTVESTVSYTLGAHDSTLVLLKDHNVNGTGSKNGGSLIGNSGNNVLREISGEGRLDGGLGNDKLIGGTGHDVFVFDKGYAHDTVVHYSQDSDEFVISNFSNVMSFAQLKSHMSEHGSDTWIDFGHGDLLVVKDFDFHQFQANDFTFGA